jgi:hypothetical protein
MLGLTHALGHPLFIGLLHIVAVWSWHTPVAGSSISLCSLCGRGAFGGLLTSSASVNLPGEASRLAVRDLSPLEIGDRQLAGLLMWIPEGAALCSPS